MAKRTPPAAPRTPAAARAATSPTRKTTAAKAAAPTSTGRKAASRTAAADKPAPPKAKTPTPNKPVAPRARKPLAPGSAGEQAARGRKVDTGNPAVPGTPAQRERRFNLLLHTACLKAGTAAAFASITAKVPMLAKLAPVLLGAHSDRVALPSIQKQLVRDVLDLYALPLSDTEERGVILLATGAELGAERLSQQLAEQILAQTGGGYLRFVAARMLPLASIATDSAAAVATTYTVGKRAQVLCNLPGSGARNLGELLRGLSGIDQRRLFTWSAEALRLALGPFRGVLMQLRPGA